jgi:hypothetical protein
VGRPRGPEEEHDMKMTFESFLCLFTFTDSSEKKGGGSLSSLKPKESKWVSLRKKLKINSSSGSKKSVVDRKEGEEDAAGTGKKKGIEERRSLFQRAKTLAILPVSKTQKERDEAAAAKKQHHMVREPPELFNVGGEMNMIPLELLININDLNMSK